MRKIVMVGSIGAAIIIVLAMMPTIVSAQISKDINSEISTLKSAKTISERINVLQQLMKEKGLSWYPGMYIIGIIITIIMAIFFFYFPTPPPP